MLLAFQFSDGLSDKDGSMRCLRIGREACGWGQQPGSDRFRDTKVTTMTIQEGLPDGFKVSIPGRVPAHPCFLPGIGAVEEQQGHAS